MDIITVLQSAVQSCLADKLLHVLELRANHPHVAKFYRLYMVVRW